MRQTLTNARIVLADQTIMGSVVLDGPTIAVVGGDVDPGSEVIDFGGDFLLPGIVDLHTDNIEHHFTPRPAVHWPSALAAVLAHDWQILGSGITTVLDSLSMGDYESNGVRGAILKASIETLDMARANGLLKSDHYFHFRCELSDASLLELVAPHMGNPRLRLISMMDHTPGQRQWRDLAIYREYRRKKSGRVWDDADWDGYVATRQALQAQHVGPARAWIGQAAKEYAIPMASHDDTTLEDVNHSHADAIAISEFPTTLHAAQRARELGMQIVMGAPNVVLGGSHSGNVSAAALADAGLLDMLTSDYVPASMLHAAFILAQRGLELHDTIAMVSARPAAALGFADRGRIESGLRADVLRAKVFDGVPVIGGIWVAGKRYL